MESSFRTPIALVMLASLIPVSLPLVAQTADSSAEQYPAFDYALDVRYRYEAVSQDNLLEDADASTARTRLTLTGQPMAGLKAVVEVDNVSTLGPDDYDSLVDDRYRGTHSVVADPTGTDLNQVYLDYEWSPGDGVAVGRQRIVHGNQRFIGGVAWRQNEQTYEGATLRLSNEATQFTYSYVGRVQRIFGAEEDSIQPESLGGELHLLRSDFSMGFGELGAFLYALDFDTAAGMSSMTLGVDWAGELGPVALTAAYALQEDHAGNPASFRTDYLALKGSLPLGPLKLNAGFERLGSDDGQVAFSTPLATLHMFQGWADVFLNTPGTGMEDAYIGLSGELAEVAVTLVYHDFRSARGSIDYGSEWNLQASYPLSEHISTSLKYANYQADEYATDTKKLWFSLQFAF